MKLSAMTGTAALVLAALGLAGCAEEPAEMPGETSAAPANGALDEALASDLRGEDSARDQYRNPAETLAFFKVQPDHTVIEYAPGGGWYTRILAPYLAESGRYIGVGFSPESAASLGDDFVEQMRESGGSFSQTQAQALGLDAQKVPFYFTDAIPDEINGTVDRALVIRMTHNLMRWGIAESEIAALYEALKPGGMAGVVQHRAKDDAPLEYVDGSKGYLKYADTVALFEGAGFEFVESSEINANPEDTADYPDGVWTLPPTYARGDEDREQYAAIGESDRMTLLFRKPA